MRVLSVALISVLLNHAALSQEVVSDEPLAKREMIASLPVMALRKIPLDRVIVPASDAKDGWVVSISAAVGSALSSKQTSAAEWSALYRLSPSGKIEGDEWLSSAKGALPIAVEEWERDYARQSGLIQKNPQWPASTDDIKRKTELLSIIPKLNDMSANESSTILFSDGSIEQVNPSAVGLILSENEIIKSAKKGQLNGNFFRIPDLKLDPDFAAHIRQAYFPIKSLAALATDMERLPALSSAIQQATLNLPTAAALLINVGEAGFGTPLVFTSAEKFLTVEPSLARRYDIYWLQLALNPSEELIQNSVELRYDIEIDNPDVLTMAIAPERFGTEVSATQKANTPSVKIGNIEVGEMFRRTVEYKYIRPTIIGHGVQTSSFGWIFTGEALDASAKRLFAVLGVPKGSKTVATKFQASVKLTRYFGLAEEWASTGPTPYTIQLLR